MNIASMVISLLALLLSGVTAWVTLFRKGIVRMTRPSQIFFGHDGGPIPAGRPSLKVYFRTLLYATAKRGGIIESMYVRLRRGEASQNFNIWVHGEKRLERGCGMFVPESGVAVNHHFLLPPDETGFRFLAGTYVMEIFASFVGDRRIHRLHKVGLTVGEREAESLKTPKQGLYFDWGPDTANYISHLRPHPILEMVQDA